MAELGNIMTIIAVLSLTGCKFPFELDYKGVEPLIVIKSYICADSLASIDVRKAVPLAKLAQTDSTLINPHYSIKCNGADVESDASMVGESGMLVNTAAFKAGDRIEVVIESDDTEKALASTTIPEFFPEYELEICKSNNSARNLKISYKDNPRTTDYYGAVVKWKGKQKIYVGPDEEEYQDVTDCGIYPPGGYTGIQIEPDAYSPIVISFKDGFLYVWKDADEEDNEYDLLYNYRQQWDGAVGEVKEAEIQCTLLKLSEEMYRHLFAEFDRLNNPFAQAGFSSPAFTYSNVRNGLGYLCGYSIVKSDWIKDNLFEEE